MNVVQKKIALIGMPNTGKSTFFNRLTGSTARVGNWPGITVDLMTSKVILGDVFTQVIDLPGIYSFHGFSEDEKVVRSFLERHPVDLICVILNATQIDRQLSLALQVVQLGVPVLVLLNMQKYGIQHIQAQHLLNAYLQEQQQLMQMDLLIHQIVQWVQ